jgi:hypothetical protein
MQTQDLIDHYCQAWSDPDPQRRASLLSSVWTDGATYCDPTVPPLDAAGLLAHIARIQAGRPGAVVLRSTPVDAHHGVARFGFKVVGMDGAVLRAGEDIVELSSDGLKIERVIGFFGALGASA